MHTNNMPSLCCGYLNEKKEDGKDEGKDIGGFLEWDFTLLVKKLLLTDRKKRKRWVYFEFLTFSFLYELTFVSCLHLSTMASVVQLGFDVELGS